jgi:hypothetical protein
VSHDFANDIRKAGPHSAWCGGKTIDYIRENGVEVEFCFTDGTTARFEWVDPNGSAGRFCRFDEYSVCLHAAVCRHCA